MKSCTQCEKEITVLEMFSGGECLECYEQTYIQLTRDEQRPQFGISLLNI